MKPLKLISIFIPLLCGVAAAFWTTLDLWYEMKEGLLAFLGFLAASLVQVMPLTANFLQSDRLSQSEAKRLTASLTKQQHYWMGLLTATIVAMVILIVGAVLKSRVADFPLLFQSRFIFTVSWSAAVCFCIVTSISFVLMKMLGLFEGLLTLHNLRVELVINSAKRSDDEKNAAIYRDSEISIPLVPKDYGQIIRNH